MTTSFHIYTDSILGQVKDAEQRLRHKLYPPNAWMKVSDFNVLTSCPKDKLHQWFIGFYGEHIIPAIVHRYTSVLQRPDLIWLDKNKVKHPIISNEAVARVFQWSEKIVRALPCSHALCWKDSGPSWTGSSHSVLSGRQCHIHYSSQVCQPTKDGL